jgi:hypothetical protein
MKRKLVSALAVIVMFLSVTLQAATIKRSFKGETTTSLNGTTLSGSEQSSGDIDMETSGYVAAQVDVAITFLAGSCSVGDEDITIRVYGSLDGTNYDTIVLSTTVIECVASATTKRIYYGYRMRSICYN